MPTDYTKVELTFYCDDQRHLICVPYSVPLLHEMARRLNIKRCWYHSASRFKHYDIPKRRIVEIQAKCQVVSARELLSLIKTHSGVVDRHG